MTLSPELERTLFGPFEVGELLEVGCAYFGMVFRAGPKRFWLVHENGDVTYHEQTYRGFRRASFYGSFGGDTEWHDKVVAEAERDLERFYERCREWKERRRCHSS